MKEVARFKHMLMSHTLSPEITLEDLRFELHLFSQQTLYWWIWCVYRVDGCLSIQNMNALFPFLSCWFTVICGHRPGGGNITPASLRTRQLIYQCFSLRPVEIRQRKRENISYDSWAAATETMNLFGCAGQQSDNGWRGLLEPAVPLGFVNAVRGGWRGSSAFISTFRDAHSCWPVDSAYLFCSPYCLPFYC